MQYCNNLNCESETTTELISDYVVSGGLVLCQACNALKNDQDPEIIEERRQNGEHWDRYISTLS